MASVVPRITQALAGPVSRAARGAPVVRVADSTVHVQMTMNNIHITVSDVEGATVSRATGGMLGFKHRTRAEPDAAKVIAEQAASKAVQHGHQVAHVHFRGPSKARGQILLGVVSGGLQVADVRDVTPIPTNGCRPKHARRL